jgi:2-hydroxychromene-2-carboxylate isomerase
VLTGTCLMPTSRRVDFWFEFASTYSYPAALRIAPLAAKAGVGLRWRPFLLGPILRAHGLDDSPFNLHPVKGRYMWRDLERMCAALDLPLRRPQPFPQPSLLAARVALVAFAQAFGEDLVRAVYTAQFADGQQIGDRAVLAALIAGLGGAAEAVLARAESDDVKLKLRAETEAARTTGIFGAPSFVTADGELFWGNDRLEAALAWATRAPG